MPGGTADLYRARARAAGRGPDVQSPGDRMQGAGADVYGTRPGLPGRDADSQSAGNHLPSGGRNGHRAGAVYHLRPGAVPGQSLCPGGLRIAEPVHDKLPRSSPGLGSFFVDRSHILKKSAANLQFANSRIYSASDCPMSRRCRVFRNFPILSRPAWTKSYTTWTARRAVRPVAAERI